ncbi:MAG: preprotein translocase subunit SecG, partial [Muribaculaceae bacterium]|nr:preprotein translocase subunit SecG [Muribaculaceae bacterium]
LACVLLIAVVLIQKSKGGGLASDYSSGNQYLGYRKTTDFIEKATWGLGIVICVLSICASFAVKTPVTRSAIETKAPATTPASAPTAPAPANQVPAAK